MASITVLDQNTINKIAAGEVIERPASVVKELLENAIDAKATAVTVEIKEGGTSLIRVTDNGCGIPRDEIATAFLRHATSKIRAVEDLFTISSLGFRGEALASIAAVSKVEIITKTTGSLCGYRYQIEGGIEKGLEEVGAPEGTTFIARDLFFNTPARKKFLKRPMTEGAYVADLVERIALSHPDISIRFIQNNQNKLYTSGNHSLRDLAYTVFGREVTANLVAVEAKEGPVFVGGFIGKPLIARGNRNYENYFVNGRYVRSSIVSKAIEEAYKPFLMQHKYPFTLLHFSIDQDFLDVNVHPTKMELRFEDGEQVYRAVYHAVTAALSQRELIPQVGLEDEAEKREEEKRRGEEPRPEPFEVKRRNVLGQEENREDSRDAAIDYRLIPQKRPAMVGEAPSAYGGLFSGFASPAGSKSREGGVGEKTAKKLDQELFFGVHEEDGDLDQVFSGLSLSPAAKNGEKPPKAREAEPLAGQESPGEEAAAAGGEPENGTGPKATGHLKEPAQGQTASQPAAPAVPQEALNPVQMDLFDEKFLSPKSRLRHKLIGQLFETYWLVEYDGKLIIIDQHAAHEKILYERTMEALKNRQFDTQMVDPPIILTLTMNEELLFNRYKEQFSRIGFEIEHFGGREYAVRGVPANLPSIAREDLLMEMLDGLSEDSPVQDPQLLTEKVASMSCKAAVKGNHAMSFEEANQLIDQLLSLENPYNCPHGRPVIISMTKYELEKKFKRIV